MVMKHRLRMFEKRVLRRILYPRGIMLKEAGGNCTKRCSIIYTLHKILG
jgi:hypothetical protein